MPCMTHRQLISKLTDMAKESGSQTALAAKFGVSPSYLSEVLRGTRLPGDKILAALGLEKRIVFKSKEQAA